jgi:hypothetical protein
MAGGCQQQLWTVGVVLMQKTAMVKLLRQLL